MRIELDWKRFGTIAWFLVSLAAALGTLLQLFISDLPRSRDTSIKIAAVVVLLSLLAACLLSRFPKSLTWRLRDHDADRPTIRIGRGNLFADPSGIGNDTVTVVTTNLHFALDNEIEVKNDALIAQLADLSPGNRDGIREQADVDAPKAASVGEIQEVVLDGRRYWLLAVAEVKQVGVAGHNLPMTNLWIALRSLWERADLNAVSLRMPIIGSGYSGAHQDHESLLMVVALSLIAHRTETETQNYDSIVDVVVHHKDLTPGRMRRFANSLRDMGFVRVR